MQDHNTDERKWHLAAKVLTSGLDPSEEAEWEALKRDVAFQQAFELVRQNWNKLDTLPHRQIDVGEDWKQVWEKIRQHVPPVKRRSIFPSWIKYAAVLLIGVSASFFIGWGAGSLFRSEADAPISTTIEAPPGSKTQVTLPDSSKVWLNAHSRISFDRNFGTKHRALSLEGEAFFDVIKKNVPFEVHTPVYDITVLGTAFNVKTYVDDDNAVTTLVRGSVSVGYRHPSGRKESIVLKPNEKLIASRAGSGTAFSGDYTFSLEKGIDTAMETAWKDGWLSVSGESLSDLAKKIERLYDIKIVFHDEGLQRYRYTGRIRQLSLEQVLKALSLTSPVEFSITEKTVELRENKSTRSKYKSLQTP